MINSGNIARMLASAFGSTLRDVETGDVLGKAFIWCWRGRIQIIGYTGEVPLRPVALPGRRLTYWKTTLGFTTPKQPDFPNIR